MYVEAPRILSAAAGVKEVISRHKHIISASNEKNT